MWLASGPIDQARRARQPFVAGATNAVGAALAGQRHSIIVNAGWAMTPSVGLPARAEHFLCGVDGRHGAAGRCLSKAGESRAQHGDQG
ncbi:hypothetical protein CBM2598_U10209 [Cupriavidus taiwanensis]|nr:hypothetical protein CBM2598_U10209 [Cupriavidus taiwanensis]